MGDASVWCAGNWTSGVSVDVCVVSVAFQVCHSLYETPQMS